MVGACLKGFVVSNAALSFTQAKRGKKLVGVDKNVANEALNKNSDEKREIFKYLEVALGL